MKKLVSGKMSGKMRLTLFCIVLLIISVIFLVASYAVEMEIEHHVEEIEYEIEEDEHFKEKQKKKEEQKKLEQTKTVKQLTKEQISFEDKLSVGWDSGDEYLLAKIAMAAAESESVEGKALVMRVVLNRVYDDAFPDTVGEVIFQHSGDTYQFSPIKNGSYFKKEPDEDCWKALELVYSGWDESQGALYFESNKVDSTWQSRNLDLLFEEGGHKFYK